MLIAIPSKGRAGKVKSLKVLPQAVLFVPEYEVKDYKKAQYPNIVGVPGDVKGITKTRNWILKESKDEEVVFIDDDVKIAGWRKLHSHHVESKSLNPKQWDREFNKLFELTRDLNYRLWGIGTDEATRSQYPYKPFLWNSYVTASCCGIINDGRTYYDESFPVKEDYELCLRLMKEDGGTVGARHIYWHNSHWTDPGGCTDYRTQQMEKDCIYRLKDMYPGMVRQITRGGSGYSISIN